MAIARDAFPVRISVAHSSSAVRRRCTGPRSPGARSRVAQAGCGVRRAVGCTPMPVQADDRTVPTESLHAPRQRRLVPSGRGGDIHCARRQTELRAHGSRPVPPWKISEVGEPTVPAQAVVAVAQRMYSSAENVQIPWGGCPMRSSRSASPMGRRASSSGSTSAPAAESPTPASAPFRLPQIATGRSSPHHSTRGGTHRPSSDRAAPQPQITATGPGQPGPVRMPRQRPGTRPTARQTRYAAIHHPEQTSNDPRNDEDPARSCDRTGSRHHS